MVANEKRYRWPLLGIAASRYMRARLAPKPRRKGTASSGTAYRIRREPQMVARTPLEGFNELAVSKIISRRAELGAPRWPR